MKRKSVSHATPAPKSKSKNAPPDNKNEMGNLLHIAALTHGITEQEALAGLSE